MTAYYNEHDPKAAAWLRELIRQGSIAPGEVDERSIEDVLPSDLAPFRQCHFFAGIGVWSYALRQAGWSDEQEVWTGSCPCQPFSAAGKGGGFDDERHLWPAWFWLISQCRPSVIFGEQVASRDGLTWLDLVASDLEGAQFTFGSADLCAAGVGAPHIRQRLYFVAHTEWNNHRRQAEPADHSQQEANRPSDWTSRRSGASSQLADTEGAEQSRPISQKRRFIRRSTKSGLGNASSSASARNSGILAEDTQIERHERAEFAYNGGSFELADTKQRRRESRRQRSTRQTAIVTTENSKPSACNGFWRDAEWIYCRDDKWRAIKPGNFPLVARTARSVGYSSDISFPTDEARVMRLRGYGNSIVAPLATEFIKAYMEIEQS